MTNQREPTAPKLTSANLSTSMRRRIWRRLILVVPITIAGLYVLSFSAKTPAGLGVQPDGRLAECPDSPNCVSSQTPQTEKKMPAIAIGGSVAEATTRIKAAIDSNFPRANLICETDNYLRYEFVSLVFRFVDDVEFLVDDKAKAIDFRSASRVGHSDLGANRKRMQIISNEMKR